MVLVHMQTWLGYIDGIHVTIYSSTMDPSWVKWSVSKRHPSCAMLCHSWWRSSWNSFNTPAAKLAQLSSFASPIRKLVLFNNYVKPIFRGSTYVLGLWQISTRRNRQQLLHPHCLSRKFTLFSVKNPPFCWKETWTLANDESWSICIIIIHLYHLYISSISYIYIIYIYIIMIHHDPSWSIMFFFNRFFPRSLESSLTSPRFCMSSTMGEEYTGQVTVTSCDT